MGGFSVSRDRILRDASAHRQTVVTIPSDRIELAKLLRGALKGIRNGDCDSGSCSQSALFHVGQFTNLTVRILARPKVQAVRHRAR